MWAVHRHQALQRQVLNTIGGEEEIEEGEATAAADIVMWSWCHHPTKPCMKKCTRNKLLDNNNETSLDTTGQYFSAKLSQKTSKGDKNDDLNLNLNVFDKMVAAQLRKLSKAG